MNQPTASRNSTFILVVAAALLATVVVLFGSLHYATTRMQVTM